MRPRCYVDAIFTFNVKDEHGAWIPTRISIGSWVTLQPGREGDHARDAAEHGGSATFEGAYKAKVLKFRIRQGCSTVPEVLVRHAYMHRQLDVEVEVPDNCNYLYLSSCEDWVDVKSITGLLWVLHADIGEAQRGDRTHEDLLQNGIFFYNAVYIPQSLPSGHGRLEPIPLPKFDDPEWPLPDMSTSEHFRFILRRDFLFSMKPNTGSRSTHLQWSMPIHVMVDLFASIEFHRTPLFFIFHNISDECFTSLMDDGWDAKHTAAADVVKCVVSKETVIFKYNIRKSILYVTFQYNRLRLQHSSQWQEMDQAESFKTVIVECEMPYGERKLALEVGSTWTLFNILSEVSMHLGCDFFPDFSFDIVEDGGIKEKVSRTNEANKVAVDLLPPLLLRIVPEASWSSPMCDTGLLGPSWMHQRPQQLLALYPPRWQITAIRFDTHVRKEIVDQGLPISTSFLKHQDSESGYGGDWALCVQAVEKLPTEREQIQAPGRQVSLFFYVADEGGSTVQLSSDVSGDGRFASGTGNEVGGWELHIKGLETKASTSFVPIHTQFD